MPESLFNKVAGLVFSCEFCEISKNTFCYRKPPVAASRLSFKSLYIKQKLETSEWVKQKRKKKRKKITEEEFWANFKEK